MGCFAIIKISKNVTTTPKGGGRECYYEINDTDIRFNPYSTRAGPCEGHGYSSIITMSTFAGGGESELIFVTSQV